MDNTTILSAERQKEWQEKLDKLPESDRVTEEEAMKADLKAKADLATRVQGMWEREKAEREARKDQGQESIVDRIANLLPGGKPRDKS